MILKNIWAYIFLFPLFSLSLFLSHFVCRSFWSSLFSISICLCFGEDLFSPIFPFPVFKEGSQFTIVILIEVIFLPCLLNSENNHSLSWPYKPQGKVLQIQNKSCLFTEHWFESRWGRCSSNTIGTSSYSVSKKATLKWVGTHVTHKS